MVDIEIIPVTVYHVDCWNGQDGGEFVKLTFKVCGEYFTQRIRGSWSRRVARDARQLLAGTYGVFVGRWREGIAPPPR